MKEVIQQFRTGEIAVIDIPAPMERSGGVIVRNAFSVISAGTERQTASFARKNLLEKARARPDLVQQVVRAAKTQGVRATLDKTMSRLSAYTPQGYSSAGVVVQVAPGEQHWQPGDRVACAGAGYANHAELVWVPRLLCARVPDAVSLEAAAYTTLGAIAMQGVRQADARLGERVVVFGCGLVGQLTVQILRAAGCDVLAVDLDRDRLALAMEHGARAGFSPDAEGFTSAVVRATGGFGADACIITAASKEGGILEQAAEMLRDRGRISVVGDILLESPRKPFYEKELELRLSRSYGPGRYDPSYEEHGVDYPIGYIRWTEQRNMESFLSLLAEKKVQVDRITTHRLPVEKADEAYSLLVDPSVRRMGIVLEYPQPADQALDRTVTVAPARRGDPLHTGTLRLGVIGTGSFAQGVLLPAVQRIDGVRITAVASATGVSARQVAQSVGAAVCSSDPSEVVTSADVDAVLIATRHESHASLAIAALRAGKHVFVEKPAAINRSELTAIHEVAQRSDRIYQVGFNRRFSPFARDVRRFLRARRGPCVLNYRVNAGYIPPSNWVQDPAVGGGRIVGEVCHFVDLMMYIAGDLPETVFALALSGDGRSVIAPDNIQCVLQFGDGSVASLTYLAEGSTELEKERVEVSCAGRSAVIDDFRSLSLFPMKGKPLHRKGQQDKGHAAELHQFVQAARSGGPSPIPLEQVLAVSEATFAIADSLASGEVLTAGSGSRFVARHSIGDAVE